MIEAHSSIPELSATRSIPKPYYRPSGSPSSSMNRRLEPSPEKRGRTPSLPGSPHRVAVFPPHTLSAQLRVETALETGDGTRGSLGASGRREWYKRAERYQEPCIDQRAMRC